MKKNNFCILNSKTPLKKILKISSLFVFLIYFSGCKVSVDSISTKTSPSTGSNNGGSMEPPAPPVPPLVIAPSSYCMQFQDNKTFSASGGEAPYTYSLVEGSSAGTINSSTGQYTPSSTYGTYHIKVTDSANSSVQATVSTFRSGNVDLCFGVSG